jgi:signal transduction histidine kinase
MGRYLAAAAVLVANLAVFVAAAHANQGPFGLVTLLAYGLQAWTAYLTGLTLPARTDLAIVVGTALGAAGLQVALHAEDVPQHVSGFVVFLVLPLLVGRYLAQHRRLVATLDAHNRQLRTERVLLAEREQLRERLRIARDMHDALGRRLSLVSVQAAALEVSDLPAERKEAVTALATSARDAVTELYQLIGSLRGAGDDTPGADRIPALVEEFRAAGATVSVTGVAGELPAAASRAAYRVVEEGLTNAAKHAAGAPVAIRLTRETDTLVITVTNPMAGQTGLARARRGPGGQWRVGVQQGGEKTQGAEQWVGSQEGRQRAQGAGAERWLESQQGEERAQGTAPEQWGESQEGAEPSVERQLGVGQDRGVQGQLGAGREPRVERQPDSELGAGRQCGGFGLAGLTERAGAASGFVDHRVEGGEFRLVAMLPTTAPDLSPRSRLSPRGLVALGVATAVLLFLLLPATVVVGVGAPQ